MPLDLVARPRLVERLNEGLARQLTLVCAPAGYGKSTLVSEWLQQLQTPSAWLTLDEGDDDLFSFLSYVVAAIQTVYPSFGQEILPLLGAHTLPSLPTLVVAFVHDLEALADGLVLVLDDLYRVIQLAIYDFLERLIPYLPPSVHFVLSTRSDPLLSLVSLRARSQLSEVRQRDLRFTSAETRAFLTQACAWAVDDATAAALETRTDGWAVGLRLFLLSVHDEAGLERLAQGVSLDDTDVTSYLVGEVVRKQAPLMQEFLLHLAIVERFSLPLCTALFQRATWQQVEEMLEQMQRQNLFVIALGEGWYRYHPLLRELLLNRLARQETAEEVGELHRRAAGWYESQGMVSEAIFHFLQAPDEALAMDVFARHRLEAMNREQWQPLEHWLAFFPRPLVEEQPLLAMTQAWIFDSQSRISRYMAILQRVEAQLAEGKPPLEQATRQLLEGEVCALASHWFLHYQGKFQAAIASAQRALELLPLHHSAGRSTAYIYLVYGCQHSGDHAGAQAALARGLQEQDGRGDVFGPRLMMIKFVIHYLAMDMAGMEEAATQMAVWAQASRLPESNFQAHYYLGILAYTRNELDVAYEHFEQVLAKRDVVHVGGAASGYVFLALIRQARGEPAEARQILDTAEAFVRDSVQPLALVANDAARAFLALLQGRTSEALAWAESQAQPPALVPRVTNMREAPMVLIKTLVSDSSGKSTERAAALLPNLLETARTARAHFLTAELLALQAKLCLNQGDPEAALEHLTEAVTLVRRVQPLRLFADLGLENSRSLIPLFEQLNQRNVAPEYLPRLLEVLAPLAAPHAATVAQPLSTPLSSPELIESLTPRESEILALMAQGLSNRAIGEQLFLSSKTVENYSLTLYSKLSVRSRGQAVARARELGLLPR
jgi:LuxR family maltose regulon positive regulatory protein